MVEPSAPLARRRMDLGRQRRVAAAHRRGGRARGRRPGVVAARVGRDLHLVDPATDAVQATVALGDPTGGVAADGHTVWATDPTRGRLLRIDPGF
jgi:hypothetical protein